NHNNLLDAGETGSSGSLDRGWSAFLTVYSREVNRDIHGQLLAFLNDTDLQTLYQKIQTIADDDTAKLIIMYRQYGPSTSTGSQQSVLGSIASLLGGSGSQSGSGTGGGGSTGTGGGTGNNSNTVQGTLASYTPDFTKKGSRQIATLYDLIGSMVSISGQGNKK